MYRNELAAAHAHNETLRRRVAELEAGQVEPSEKLLELVRRGREARVERHSRYERDREKKAIAAKRAAERERVAELAARRKRVHKACARVNLTRGCWAVPMFAMFPLFLLPLLIESTLARWILLPIAALLFVWPAIAYGLEGLINFGAISAERRWLAQLPYPLVNHVTTLETYHTQKALSLAARTISTPSPAILADLIAGMAATSRGLRRWMLERTAARTSGNQMIFELDLRNIGYGERNRYYRVWSRAIADLLAEIRDHYPVIEATVTASGR